MSDTFVPWPGDQAPTGAFSITEFRRNRSGLVISLEDLGTHRLFQLHFRKVVAFRAMDEGYRQGTWLKAAGFPMTGIFTIGASAWVDWVVEEAGGTVDFSHVVHYAIYSQDDCLDVIAREPPVVAAVSDA